MISIATDPNLSHEKIVGRLNHLAADSQAYWVCNQHKIVSRPAAVQKLMQGNATRFSLHEDSWARANWCIGGDLSSQLISRAQDIRSKHDYVRVAYSGGVDSHAILTAFRSAGVEPDEIFFWTFLNGHQVKFSTNYELHRSVVAYIDVLRQWFPKTKFTNLDFDFAQLEILRSLPPQHNPFAVYGSGMRTLPTAVALSCFRDFDVHNSITLTGADKPRVDCINGEWYCYFIDTSCLDTWGRGVQGFFLGQDPAVHISQCHAIKNLLQSQGLTSRREILAFQNSKNPKIRHAINSALARPQPFDPVVTIGKKTTRSCSSDPSESQPKVYLLNRTLRTCSQGKQILTAWKQSKLEFARYTGMNHNTSIFGVFYNLNNGQSYTVDQLFPTGWHLD